MKKLKIVFWQFRNLLERNKIFFEILGASTLSFMAIYVSLQANRIAEVQTKIMEQENLPRLEVLKQQALNSNSGIYDNTIWIIYNRGGKLLNFKIEKLSFVGFTKFYSHQWDRIEIPVDGYFEMRGTLTTHSDEMIYQIDNNKNGEKELQLYRSLLNDGKMDMDCYFAISYSDIFEKGHTAYFEINPTCVEITENEWWNLVKQKLDAGAPKYFPSITRDSVIDFYNSKN